MNRSNIDKERYERNISSKLASVNQENCKPDLYSVVHAILTDSAKACVPSRRKDLENLN